MAGDGMEWSDRDRREIYSRGLAIRAVAAGTFGVFFGALGWVGYGNQVPGLIGLCLTLSLLVAVNPILWVIGKARDFNLGDFRNHWFRDIGGVTAFGSYFGALDVPLTLSAYMIMIVSSGTFGSRRTAMWLAQWSSACVIGLLFLEEYGWLSHQHVSFAAHFEMEGRVIVAAAGIVLFNVFGYVGAEVAAQLREKAEQILRQKNELERAVREMRSANEKMVLMSALVQHDVYSPLGVVSIACEKAMAECARGDVESAMHSIQMVGDHLQSIEGAVATLTMLCVDPEHGEPAAVNLAEIVERVLGDLLGESRKRGVLIDVDGTSPGVTIRSEELYHVLRNLVSNSLRAVSDNGSGKINVRITKSGEACEIVVSDNGEGFVQTEQRSATPKGTLGDGPRAGGGYGLGLSLVRAVVAGWGGQITIGNRDNGDGAVVSVIIPGGRVDWRRCQL